jgi:hypothetical protein
MLRRQLDIERAKVDETDDLRGIVNQQAREIESLKVKLADAKSLIKPPNLELEVLAHTRGKKIDEMYESM